ncbi:hypothetical protein GQR58_028000 [Nymphon striatum]|nr:hypothetical protein GQR58_028000 [Nymphon striatum]
MELFENYTARVRLQFNQGMHKEAIQTIRSVYEFLTKAEQLIDILDYGTAESLGSTLDLAIPEYIAKSVDFILNEPSALTPDSYVCVSYMIIDKLMDLSDRSTEATRRIISVTHPAPEIVVVAMTPVVESIGKIIKAIENNPTAENETQNVNLESLEESIDKTTDDARTVLSEAVQADGQALTLETPALTITISRASAADIGKAVFSEGSSFTMPKSSNYENLAQSFIMSIIEYKSTNGKVPRYSYSNSSKDIGTTVTSFDLCYPNGSAIHVKNMTDFVVIDLKISPNSFPEFEEMQVNAYIKQGSSATPTDYHIMTTIPHKVNTDYINATEETLEEMRHTFFVPQATSFGIIETQFVHEFTDTSIFADFEKDEDEGSATASSSSTSTSSTSTTARNRPKISFIVTSSAAVCRYWNQVKRIWDDNGCYPPYTKEQKKKGRRLEKEGDTSRWGVTALKDNLLNEKHLYEITVHTGLRSRAGTKSNASFVLCGDAGDTGVRKLSDGKKQFRWQFDCYPTKYAHRPFVSEKQTETKQNRHYESRNENRSDVDDDPDSKLMNSYPGEDEEMMKLQTKSGKRDFIR